MPPAPRSTGWSVTAAGLVLTAPRRFELRRFELPDVGEDHGLLRVEACGLCGTDHEQYTGHIPSRHAFIPGHEVVGIVEQVGARAAERWGVEVGQRVAVEVFQSCRAVRRLPRWHLPSLHPQRPGDDGRVRRRRPPAGAVGRVRHPPLPRSGLDAAAGA